MGPGRQAVECFRYNYDTDPQGYVRFFGRYRGTFYEPFLLHRFPLDRHYVEIRMSTTWPVQVMRYCVYENYANTLETFSMAAWRLPKENALDVVVEPLPTTPSRFHFSRVSLRCKVERAHMYFFWNAVVPFFLICVLVFVTFLFEPDDLSGRLSVSLALLLTAVAFKFVVASSLPLVEYLTLIDRYFLLGILLIFVVSVENAIVRALDLYESEYTVLVDRLFLYISGGIWLVGHLVALLVAWCHPERLFTPWDQVQSGF